VLAAWRSASFERVYDLTERVIPRAVLDLPIPNDDEAQRELIMIAAGCLGVATAVDLGDYFWLRNPVAKMRVAELVEAGRLTPVAVEGWKQPAYVSTNARPRAPRRHHATLLSPFDSLIWNRDRTERLFGFHYRIGIYVPAPLRTHGYYVLPLLLGDELVARFDLKTDRKTGTLRVAGSHLEDGAAAATVLDGAVPEFRRLAEFLRLEHVSVAASGDLAAGLRRAIS
jgi:hypothetical protein